MVVVNDGFVEEILLLIDVKETFVVIVVLLLGDDCVEVILFVIDVEEAIDVDFVDSPFKGS